jgi:HSP90 family molecular chaperone
MLTTDTNMDSEFPPNPNHNFDTNSHSPESNNFNNNNNNNFQSTTTNLNTFPQSHSSSKIPPNLKQLLLNQLCRIIEKVLGKNVEKVVISSNLGQKPAKISSIASNWSETMSNSPIANLNPQSDNMLDFTSGKKVLELNPNDGIITALLKRVHNQAQLHQHTNNNIDSNNIDKLTRDSIWLLYETSLLTSGFDVKNLNNFSNRVFKLVSLGVDDSHALNHTSMCDAGVVGNVGNGSFVSNNVQNITGHFISNPTTSMSDDDDVNMIKSKPIIEEVD